MRSIHQMLLRMIEVIVLGQNVSKEEAYNLLIEFIGYKIGVDPGMVSPTLQVDVWRVLDTDLDIEQLKSQVNDHLGYLHHKEIETPDNIFYSDMARARHLVSVHDQNNTATSPLQPMIDPSCGSGAILLAMHGLADTKYMYYGADYNIVAYRTALVNMKLYGIDAKILRCDSRFYTVTTDSPNWQYANMWTPPDIKRFEKSIQQAVAE